MGAFCSFIRFYRDTVLQAHRALLPPLRGKVDPAQSNAGAPSLRDLYEVGRCIGQGACGIVYECTEIGSGKVFAVKMVDKVETELEAVEREAYILKGLDHPCVMKFRDLFLERCFVCIVSDLYRGGDLINAMTALWGDGYEIPARSAGGLVRQIIQAIAYLHEKGVMHCDVKGDNYLMDRPNILDPELHLVLSDFGLARVVSEGERMTSRVGTSEFWSPEVFLRDYGIKADVWAAGVLMYGMLASKFPFNGERAVMKKNLKIPSNSTPASSVLLQGMLCKRESQRLSAAACLTQEYLVGVPATPLPDPPTRLPLETPDASPSGFASRSMVEEFHNPAVDERRQNLVERFFMPDEALGIDLSGRDFVVTHKRTGKTTTYGWRTGGGGNPKTLNEASRDARPEPGFAGVSEGLIGEMLREHGVDISQFGTRGFGAMSQFAAELEQGTARLMLDASEHKKLVRVVDVVVARISVGSEQDTRFLVQTAGQHPDGRERLAVNQFPGHKKAPHENTKECVARLLVQRLGMPDDCVKFDAAPPTVSEMTYESPTYPGVCTVYRKEIVTGRITSSAPDLLAQACAISGGETALGRQWAVSSKDGAAHKYSWLSEAECAARGVALEEQSLGLPDSVFIEAPIRMDVPGELASFLLSHGVDPAVFSGGRDGLNALLREVNTGMCALEEKDGALLRVVKVVLINLQKLGTNEVLVIVGEDGAESDRKLPGEKVRPDENIFFAAKRFFSNTLRLKDENLVSIDPTKVKVVETTSESPTFVGLSTLYRKYIVTATFE